MDVKNYFKKQSTAGDDQFSLMFKSVSSIHLRK